MGRGVVRAARIALRLAVFVLIVILAAFGYYLATNPTFRETASAIAAGSLSPERAFPGRKYVDILIIGRDVDIDEHQQPRKTRGRADLIMLVRADFVRHRASLLSVPRDTRARIPGHRTSKINVAHAIGGPRLVEATLRDLLGVRPDYYVVAAFGDLARAIDGVGGLGLTVDKRMDYDDDWGRLHIHLKPGHQRLNGSQAVGFVRYRKSNKGDADTDLRRVARQQQMLLALEKKARDPRVWLTLPGAAHELRSRLETDLSYPQMLCLSAFAARLPQGALESATIPGRMGHVFIYPDVSAARKLCARLFPRE
jgi:LCP family protein required for cell wall assembly